jgi:hypothetical protein
MMPFKSDLPRDGTMLCLGAHCGAIEIGRGALTEPRERNLQLRFVWVIFSGTPCKSAKGAIAVALPGAGGGVTMDMHCFRHSYFPDCGADIKESFEEVRRRVQMQGTPPRRSMHESSFFKFVTEFRLCKDTDG